MTTNVKIEAHPAKGKVEVQILDGQRDGQNVYLEPGETQEFVIYEGRSLVITEVDPE